MRVRRVAPRDLDAVVALAVEAAPERAREAWREVLEEECEHPERLLLVAEVEGELVGYGRARLLDAIGGAPTGYYLTGLFVRAGSRRAGVGAALTEARLRWIAERADEAWFFANARNDASIALHRRFGFEEVTRDFDVPGVTFDGGQGILFRSPLRAWRRRVQDRGAEVGVGRCGAQFDA